MRSIFPLVGLKASSGFSAVMRAAKQCTCDPVLGKTIINHPQNHHK
jgi:hypothetical protein